MKISQFPKNIISFLREVKSEVKKVNWPTTKEVIRYTLMVVLISVFVAIFLGGLDYLYTLLLKTFIF